MKVRLLRNIGIGGTFHKAGDVVEVSLSLGLELIGGKRAELVEGKAPATKGVISTENGLDPAPKDEDPAPPKRSDKRK